jgi:hypothetical protein
MLTICLITATVTIALRTIVIHSIGKTLHNLMVIRICKLQIEDSIGQTEKMVRNHQSINKIAREV